MSDTVTEAGETPEATTDLYGCPTVTGANGQTVVFVPRERYLEVVESFKSDGFNMCIDVTCTDYLAAPNARTFPVGVEPQRFEIVVNLLSMYQKRRVRIRTQVPANEPVVPTLFDLYPGSEAMEREIFDMFGIRFSQHPDLTRILMPEDWEGHPLRKDYSQGRIPVQFKYTEDEYDTSRTARSGDGAPAAARSRGAGDPAETRSARDGGAQ